MKKALCLLLACLLLCGCSAQPAPEPSAPTVDLAPAETEPLELYAPEHPLAQSAPGADCSSGCSGTYSRIGSVSAGTV